MRRGHLQGSSVGSAGCHGGCDLVTLSARLCRSRLLCLCPHGRPQESELDPGVASKPPLGTGSRQHRDISDKTHKEKPSTGHTTPRHTYLSRASPAKPKIPHPRHTGEIPHMKRTRFPSLFLPFWHLRASFRSSSPLQNSPGFIPCLCWRSLLFEDEVEAALGAPCRWRQAARRSADRRAARLLACFRSRPCRPCPRACTPSAPAPALATPPPGGSVS